MQQLPQGFVLDTPSPQTASQAGPAPVIMGRPKAPDPYKVEQDAIDNARANIGTNLSVEGGERSARGQVQDFRKEFYSSMPVRTYGIAIQSLANAIKRGEDGSGDVALIYDYAKAMDPESVVRESEVAMAQSGQSSIESAVANLKKELGVEGGGALNSENRQRLRREIINAARSRLQAYNQQREYFTGIAQRNNFNAEDVIGPHLGTPYRDDLSHFGVSGRRFTADEMAARAGNPADAGHDPESVGRSMRVPGATMDNIVFEMDAGTGAFGSETTGKRLTAAEERDYAAFVQANRDIITPALLNSWWEAKGFGPLANADEVAKAVKEGRFSPAINYGAVDEDARAKADAMARERYGDDYGTRASSLLKGGLMNWSDEAAGVVGAIADTFTGGSPAEGYRRERDIERAVQRKSRNDYGIGYEIAGSLATPLGWMKAPKTVGGFVKQGSALGALAGAGEGEGAVGTGTNALLGAAGGAAVGRAIPAVGSGVNVLRQSAVGQKVGNVFSRVRPEINREVVEAGQRQGIPIRQPDARPEVRNAFAAVEASPTQSQRVRNALDADAGAVQRRLEEVGGSGTGLDSLGVGESLQGAGKRYIAESGKRANALYKRAEEAAGDIQILPVQASLAIRRNINELSESGERANSGLISYLRDLNNDLARDGGISIGALRSIRSSMRGQISERNLTATDAERRVAQVLDAASEDIGKALANNPDALASFSAADKFYREKQTFIKDVVQRFTGSRNSPLSGEQAASRFQAMMREKGDYKRFSQMLSKLEPEERSDIAATIAENLGSGRNGEFSLAALSTNIGKLSPRALRDLFGEDGAKALADLKVIARAKADTRSGLNLSKSGVVMAHGNKFKELLLAAVGGGVAGGPGAVGGMAAGSAFERLSSNRAAKLLLNPDFTKWLRKTPDSTDPEVINRHFNRLNKIASRDQAFLMDAQALQDYLRRASSESIGRAAATRDQEQDDRRE